MAKQRVVVFVDVVLLPLLLPVNPKRFDSHPVSAPLACCNADCLVHRSSFSRCWDKTKPWISKTIGVTNPRTSPTLWAACVDGHANSQFSSDKQTVGSL